MGGRRKGAPRGEKARSKSVNPARYQAALPERPESRKSALRECLATEEQRTPDLDQRCPWRSACKREHLSTRVDARPRASCALSRYAEAYRLVKS